jgi:hypothetical protein
MTNKTEAEQAVIQAAKKIFPMVDSISRTTADPLCKAECTEFANRVVALLALDKPAIDPAIKHLKRGVEIEVSQDGKEWREALYLGDHGFQKDKVSAWTDADETWDYEYARLSPTAKSIHAWQPNKGEMPCDKDRYVIVKFPDGAISIDEAGQFSRAWVTDNEKHRITEYSFLE